MATINIGNNFSKDPAGRYYTDGDSSGEQFREEVLRVAVANLQGDEKLIIILDDDVDSYGSSFLNEAFGGMVKYGYLSAENLKAILHIDYSDSDYEFYKNKIFEYIDNANYDSEEYVSTKDG